MNNPFTKNKYYIFMKKLIICLTAYFTLSTAIKAQTVVPYLKKNGKYVLVNATTMKPIANSKQFDEADELEGGFWQLCIGKNCGLYNKQGKQLLPPKKLIFREQLQGNFFKSFQASEFAGDGITGLYGLVDTSGLEIVPTKYQYIWNFQEGLISFSTYEGNHGFIDKKGKVTIQGIKGNVYAFSNGVAKVEHYLPNNSKVYYYIDKTGKTILKPSMNDVEWYEDFFEEVASFKQKSTDLTGLINIKGEIALKPQFQEISYFSNGMAAAKLNDKYGFINKAGTFIIKNEYDEFKSFEKELILVKKGKFYGAIDSKGKEIIPFKYEELEEYKDGLLIFSYKGRYDFYNSNGQLIFDITINEDENDNVGSVAYGYAIISLAKETLLINAQGKQIKIPNAENDGTIIKTPNYIQVIYAGGSEFKNYFISMSGKVYKQ
jgi:hypothetical protein